MQVAEPVNILLVDDQPAKLLSYEAVLSSLGENLIRAGSAREALEQLLKQDIAVILVDVCMPELDGFQLAAMIREHPRFKQTAMLFVSAVQLGDLDRVRGYQLGAVDYVPVPVIPELLRAKVKVFVELYRNSRELEKVNQSLEKMVAERTAELMATNARLNLAIESAGMGAFDIDLKSLRFTYSNKLGALWSRNETSEVMTLEQWLSSVHPDDRPDAEAALWRAAETGAALHHVFRVQRDSGPPAWFDMRGHIECDPAGAPMKMLGIVTDITEAKRAEQQQRLMIQELHHRVKNTLATVQSIAGLSGRTARDIGSFCEAFNSRIISLSKTHTLLLNSDWQRIRVRDLLANELESYEDERRKRIFIDGPDVSLPSQTGLALGLALHELATNAAKYGALSSPAGKVIVEFEELPRNGSQSKTLQLRWLERDGPVVEQPQRIGFGSTLLKRLFGEKDGLRINYAEAGLDVTLKLECADP